MKKAAIVLIMIALIVSLFLALAQKPHAKIIKTGNTKQAVIEIEPGEYQCAQCKMPVEKREYAAQVAIKNGKTWFFDDIGCMALWLGNQPFRQSAVVWVYTRDTHRWINGRDAWYTQLENTPMGYGFGAYEKHAENTLKLDAVIDHMLKGENLTNHTYAKTLLQKTGHR
ncbi:MAG: hypothetical protein GXO33_07350 [Epsilonproteobacteria bacterium]|nr:hypothetical protein [Campylobacterota bacterium]